MLKRSYIFVLSIALSGCSFYQDNPAPVVSGWQGGRVHKAEIVDDNASVQVTPMPSAAEQPWKQESVTATSATPIAASTPSAKAAPGGPMQWQWPARGKVVARFASNKKGIEIAGKQGQPVHAAASGVVLYAGSGLAGYGKLLIIKHNEEYLSAYGHNSQLMVQEGASVRAGQIIALMGSSGGAKPGLHFEIRRNRKPIDPLPFLQLKQQ